MLIEDSHLNCPSLYTFKFSAAFHSVPVVCFTCKITHTHKLSEVRNSSRLLLTKETNDLLQLEHSEKDGLWLVARTSYRYITICFSGGLVITARTGK